MPQVVRYFVKNVSLAFSCFLCDHIFGLSEHIKLVSGETANHLRHHFRVEFGRVFNVGWIVSVFCAGEHAGRLLQQAAISVITHAESIEATSLGIILAHVLLMREFGVIEAAGFRRIHSFCIQLTHLASRAKCRLGFNASSPQRQEHCDPGTNI